MVSPIRKLCKVLAGLAIVTASTLAVASPAQAATCYNKGNYSFKYTQHSTFFYTIDGWGANGCSGTSSVRGEAYGNYNNQNAVRIVAHDVRCDNYGFTVYTHVRSVASTGCGTTSGSTITFSQIRGYPYNFWINFHGVNSNAHTLPPMAP
jgi:hypothetical protein